MNSELLKLLALSATIIDGNPNCENIRRNVEMIAFKVIEFIVQTCIHFEWASMTIRNMCPKKNQRNRDEAGTSVWLATSNVESELQEVTVGAIDTENTVLLWLLY